MRGYDIGLHIIGRMLNRRKRIDILPYRQYDDTARMLARTSSDAGTAGNEPVDLTDSFLYTAVFIIVFYIPVRRLIRQRADRSRTISLPVSENNFRIFMRLTLVFSGKVKIDIRLFIAFESEERFKRNIKSFFLQRRTADRTVFIRHIASCAAAESAYFFRIEIIVMTIWTQIMRT